MINNITMTGNLTKDVEIKYFPNSGIPYAIFSIANNRKYNDAQGETKEKTCFIEVKFYGNFAKNIQSFIKKGSKVAVSGRLEQDVWEDEEKRTKSKHFIVAQTIEFLDSKNKNNNDDKNPVLEISEEQIPF